MEKTKASSEQQFCRLKGPVDKRHQRRMAKLVRGERKATVTFVFTNISRKASQDTQKVIQIATFYSRGEPKSISEPKVW